MNDAGVKRYKRTHGLGIKITREKMIQLQRLVEMTGWSQTAIIEEALDCFERAWNAGLMTGSSPVDAPAVSSGNLRATAARTSCSVEPMVMKRVMVAVAVHLICHHRRLVTCFSAAAVASCRAADSSTMLKVGKVCITLMTRSSSETPAEISLQVSSWSWTVRPSSYKAARLPSFLAANLDSLAGS